MQITRFPLYCLTVYRQPIYRGGMSPVIENQHTVDRFGEPPFTPHPSALWILTLVLSTCALGAILFLVLVVAPSAGAAGGCGGG